MIEILAETDDRVTIRRADYEALLEAVEDARDVATARRVLADVAAGRDEFIPMELVDSLLAGESPVRVWREYRAMTGRALAEAAGIPPSYLSQIEAGRKPGSFRAMAAIAKALRISMEDLEPVHTDAG
jgi:DNA-binding XRE family transcriptional regulator